MNNLNNFTDEELKLVQSALLCLWNEIRADKKRYSEMELHGMEAPLISAYDKVWGLYCKISTIIIDKNEEE